MNTQITRNPTTSIGALVRRTARLATAVTVFSAVSAADGRELRWDGGHGNWSTPSNWDLNVAPSDGDTLIFPNQGLNANTTNNIVGLNLNSIRISAGMDLYGNPVGVSNEVFVFTSHPLGTGVGIYLDINLDAEVTITAYANASINGTVYVYGDINTGSHNLNVGDSGILAGAPVYLSGAVSGSGSVTKFGDGTVRMEVSTANTYSGTTTVEEGLLVLNKSVQNAVPNALIIGGNGTGDPSATVRQDASFQIGTDVTINRMGTYNLNGFAETIRDLNLNGGADFDSGSSTLTLSGDLTVDGGVSTVAGNLGLALGTHEFNILYDGLIIWPGAHCYLNANVSGSGSLRKRGPGNMRVWGNNNYSGATTVEAGSFMIESDTALGSTGAGTTVNAGARLYLSAFNAAFSRHIGLEALTLGGTLYSGGYSNSWAGDVVLTSDVMVDVYGDYLNLAGTISGTGGFTKDSSGDLILSGSNANTYTGATAVNEGQLLLGKTALSPYYAIGFGSLTVGDGTGAAGSALVKELGQYQLGSIPITVNGDGLLDLNGFYDTVGNNLTLNDGGDVQTGAGGTLAMGANSQITVSSTSAYSTISGNMNLGGGVCAVNVASGRLSITAAVSGSAGITKTGSNQLWLYAANTYGGATIVNQGNVYVLDDSALGTTNGATTVNAGAALILHSSSHVGAEPLTLQGAGNGSLGALASIYGQSSWAGPITLAGSARITTFQVADELVLSGSIGGSGDVTLEGAGTVICSGSTANTYAGDTHVNSGTLVLGKSVYNVTVPGDLYIGDGMGGPDADVVRLLTTSQIPGTSRVILAGSGLFDMNNLTEYLGSLQGSGHVDMGSGNLGPGEDGTSTTFSGLIEGSGELRKYGAGTFILSGNNIYSGPTRIYGGRLQVNGSQPGSAVLVSSAGTLGGIGTVGAITSSGSVAPGVSPGRLGSGSATLQSGSSFDLEVNGVNPVDYDQLDVGGTVSLGNSHLNVSFGFLPAVGDAFTIIDNDGADAVAGTFNGLAEGASLVVDTVTLEITYLGGTGNDVVLQVTDVQPTEDLRITSITTVSGTVALEWTGGLPLYVVERKTALTNATWTPVTLPMSGTQTNLPMITPEAFYRVTGGN